MPVLGPGWNGRNLLGKGLQGPLVSGAGGAAGFGEAKPSQAKPSQAKPSQAKPSQAKPSQARPSQARPSQATPRTPSHWRLRKSSLLFAAHSTPALDSWRSPKCRVQPRSDAIGTYLDFGKTAEEEVRTGKGWGRKGVRKTSETDAQGSNTDVVRLDAIPTPAKSGRRVDPTSKVFDSRDDDLKLMLWHISKSTVAKQRNNNPGS